MAGESFYEQGRRAGDWINVASRVEEGKETAIVHDLAEDRYEVWHDGHCVTGTAEDFNEAQRVLSRTLGTHAGGE